MWSEEDFDDFDDFKEQLHVQIGHVEVTDPRRVGDGMKAYISYTVHTSRRDPNNPNKPIIANVSRRYRHFLWLRGALVREHQGYIIPPIPSKKMIARFSPSHIEKRRRGLQRFLERVCSHEVLSQAPELLEFLTLSEERMAEVRKEEENDVKEDGSAGSWLGLGYFKSAVAYVSESLKGSAKYEPTEEDLKSEELYSKNKELIKMLSSMQKAYNVLKEANKEVAEGWFEVGKSLNHMAESENVDPEILKQIGVFGETADRMSIIMSKSESREVQTKAEREEVEFEAPLDDLIRLAQAAQDMLSGRAEAMQKYIDALTLVETCAADLKAQKQKNKMEKAQAAQSALENAEELCHERRQLLERITLSSFSEMARFESEKDDILGELIVKFMSIQSEHAERSAAAWREALSSHHELE